MVSGCQKDIDAVCGLNTTGGLLGGMKLFILGLNLKSSAWGFGVDFSEDNAPTDELGGKLESIEIGTVWPKEPTIRFLRLMTLNASSISAPKTVDASTDRESL